MAGWIPDGLAPPPGAIPQQYPPEWDFNQPQGYDAPGLPPGIAPFDDSQGLGAPQQPLDLSPPQEAQFQPPPAPLGLAPPPEQQAQPSPLDQFQPDVISGAGFVPPPRELAPAPYSRNGQQMDPEAASIAQIGSLKGMQEQTLAQGNKSAADAYSERLAANKMQRQREQGIAQKAEQDVGQAWDEVSKAKVDPNHWWNDLSSGQKAIQIGGAMIGGFLSARQQSGRNQFMDQVNANINRDIAAQEANIGNMTRGAQGKQSLYGQMLDRFGNEDVARNMTAATLYDAQLRQVQADASKYKSPITQEETTLGLVELQKARDGALASAQQGAFKDGLELAKVETDRLQQQETARNNRSQVGLGYANLAEQKRNHDLENQAKQAELDAKRVAAGPKAVPIYGPNGPSEPPVGYASDAKPAEEARSMIAANAELDALYKRGKELLKDDYAVTGSDRRLQIEAWNAAWQAARFRASGRTDAPSNGELSKWGIDPSRILGDNAVALDESYNTARSSSAPKLRAAGVTEGAIKGMGLVDPPPATEHTGKVETTGFYEEDGIGYNTEGKGRPATDEETENYQTAANIDAENRTGKNFAYQRQQNNIHVSQRRPGPIPFPEAGTGKID